MSCLKGVLLFLAKCGNIMTDVLELFHDTFCSVGYNDSVEYTKAVSFAHQRNMVIVTQMNSLDLAESGFCTLCRN